MTNETIITSHGVTIAPAHPILGHLLWLTRTPYRLYQASERPGTRGQWTPVNLIVVDEDYIIMAEPKQETPQAETPTPVIEAVGEGEQVKLDPSQVDALFDAQDAVAAQAARIAELEAQNAAFRDDLAGLAYDLLEAQRRRDKWKLQVETSWHRAELAEAEKQRLQASVELSDAEITRLKKLAKPDPDTQIGKQEAEIEQLKAQVAKLQTQLVEKSEKSKQRVMTTSTPEIGVHKVMASEAVVDGQRGRIVFQVHENGKSNPVTDTDMVTIDGEDEDTLAALPIGEQRIIQGNRKVAWTIYQALNRQSFGSRNHD